MIPFTVTPTRVLAVALLVSLGLNAWQFELGLELRDSATVARTTAKNTTEVALACSKSVEEMSKKAAKQAQDAQTAVGQAQARAKAAEARAKAELTRVQAVPGDACASAQVETREWLTKRRAGQ